ncbi:MAG TPA: DUF222 domain-containing protein [Kofleriaceae bacterium]
MKVELEQLGERIAEQAAHLDAAMHRFLTDLREFDQRGGWYLQGARTCAHWLAWRVGWDLVTSRERVRVAGKLAEFPTIDDALRRGEVSYSKVRAMLRVATPANEVLLLDHARLMTASQLETLCRKYAVVQRHGQDPHPLGDEPRRYVHRRDAEDGMVKIEAVLHPEEAELVWAMLNHAATERAGEPAPAADDSAESWATTPASGAMKTPPATVVVVTSLPPDAIACPDDDSAESRSLEIPSRSLLDRLLDEADALRIAEAGPRGEPTTSVSTADAPSSSLPPERAPSPLRQRVNAAKRAFNRADALVTVAQRYLRGDQPGRTPIEIVLTIPESSLRVGAADPLEAGELGESYVSSETARRLSCDAGVVEVIEDEHGTPLSVGRKRRTITGALKRALRKRDSICCYPGCTNRMFLEGHHIKHWADGGETSLRNSALLRSAHHRYVHEYGYAIELGPDQRPRFRDPQGRLVTEVPERPVIADLGWPRIRAANAPLAITADTIACGWDGSPADHGEIVGHLLAADGRRSSLGIAASMPPRA